MAHIFLQQDPKVSVGDANDNPTTIQTPEQLGSLLVTYAATGSTSQLAAGYAALAVSGTPQWVQIGAVGATGATGAAAVAKFFSGSLAGANQGTIVGYLADPGNATSMSTTPMEYPAGVTPFSISTLVVRVTNNKLTTNTTVTLWKNGAPTAITLTILALSVGTNSSLPVTPVPFVLGDFFDVVVESIDGGTGNSIRMSASLS